MKREPLSLDEELKKKEVEKNARTKPRFLSKADRAIKVKLETSYPDRKSIKRPNADTPIFDTHRPADVNENLEVYPTFKRSNIGLQRKFIFDWDNKDDTGVSSVMDSGDLLTVSTEENSDGNFDALIARLNSGNEQDKERAQKLQDLRARKQTKTNKADISWYNKPLEEMSDRDWRILKEDYGISLRGHSLPNPLRFWSECSFPEIIQKAIIDNKYIDPTPIQRAVIPIAFESRDIIGIAETGSGKTAAFILPLLTKIFDGLPITVGFKKNEGPYAIVLVPTRELALQIEKEAFYFANKLNIRVTSIIGGHSFEEQAFQLAEGSHIVIATPGRLLDCIERHLIVLNQCLHVVLDEADRMIDLGFEDAVSKIFDALPDSHNFSSVFRSDIKSRQTIMLSATFPKSLEKIARTYLLNPITVTIGSLGQATDKVEQRVEMFMRDEDGSRRFKRLEEILSNTKFRPPIIIFVNKKKNCELLSKDLSSLGWNTVSLHGGKSQQQREEALQKLRSAKADCLVATDLASRGIDIPNVSLVLNFNMARNMEDYTHRIGRTGRAGKSGVAITFLGPEDIHVFYDLKSFLQKSPISRIPDELRRHEASQHRSLATTKVTVFNGE